MLRHSIYERMAFNELHIAAILQNHPDKLKVTYAVDDVSQGIPNQIHSFIHGALEAHFILI